MDSQTLYIKLIYVHLFMFKSLLRTLPLMSGNVTLVCEVNTLHSESDSVWSAYIRSASMQPVQNSLFDKRINVNLVDGSWAYDVCKYYKQHADTFYNTNYNFIQDDYQKAELEKYDADTSGRNRDYEFGCKRTSYSNTGYSYNFYAPIWMSSTDDLPDYFEILIAYENGEQHKLKIYIGQDSDTNYLRHYLYKYCSSIDNNVACFVPNINKMVYYGIDASHGGLVGIEDSHMFQYIYNQTTVDKFDYEMTKGFKNNNLIVKQILPLSFSFNIFDMMSDFEKKYAISHKVKITGRYVKDGTPCDFYDFDIDYTEKPIYEYSNSDDNYSQLIWKKRTTSTGDIYNILYNSDKYCLYESLNPEYYYANKMTPTFCGWKLALSSDSMPYITNANILYTNGQSMTYGQYPINALSIDASKYATFSNGQLLTYGYAHKDDSYSVWMDESQTMYGDDYRQIKLEYLSNWYTLVNQYKSNGINNVLASGEYWTPVENNHAYYNGVLYSFNNIDNFDGVEEFGVFLMPTLTFKESTKDANDISNKILFEKSATGKISSNISSIIEGNDTSSTGLSLDGDTKSLISFDNQASNNEYDFSNVILGDKAESLTLDQISSTIYTETTDVDDCHTYVKFDTIDQAFKSIGIDIEYDNYFKNDSKKTYSGCMERFKVCLFEKDNIHSPYNLSLDMQLEDFDNTIFISSDLQTYKSRYYLSTTVVGQLVDYFNQFVTTEIDYDELINSIDEKWLLVIDPSLEFLSNPTTLFYNKNIIDSSKQLLRWPYTCLDLLVNESPNIFTYGYVERITKASSPYFDTEKTIDDVHYTSKLWVDANGVADIEGVLNKDDADKYKEYLLDSYKVDPKADKDVGKYASYYMPFDFANPVSLVEIETIEQLVFEVSEGYPITYASYCKEDKCLKFYRYDINEKYKTSYIKAYIQSYTSIEEIINADSISHIFVDSNSVYLLYANPIIMLCIDDNQVLECLSNNDYNTLSTLLSNYNEKTKFDVKYDDLIRFANGLSLSQDEILQNLYNSIAIYKLGFNEVVFDNIQNTTDKKALFGINTNDIDDTIVLDLYVVKQLLPFTGQMLSHINDYGFQYYIYRDMADEEKIVNSEYIAKADADNVDFFSSQYIGGSLHIVKLLENVNNEFVYNDVDGDNFNNMVNTLSSISVENIISSGVLSGYVCLEYNRDKQSYITEVSSYADDNTSISNLVKLVAKYVYKCIQDNDDYISLALSFINMMLDANDFDEYKDPAKRLLELLYANDDEDGLAEMVAESDISSYIDEINEYISNYIEDTTNIFSDLSSWSTLTLANLLLVGDSTSRRTTLDQRWKTFISYNQDIRLKVLVRNLLRMFKVFETSYDNDINVLELDAKTIRSTSGYEKYISLLANVIFNSQKDEDDVCDVFDLLFNSVTLANEKIMQTFTNITNWLLANTDLSLYTGISGSSISMSSFDSDLITTDITSKVDPALHIITVQDDEGNLMKKACYLISIDVNNSTSYDLPDGLSNIFIKVNDVDILDEDGKSQFIDKVFNELVPLMNENVFTKYTNMVTTVVKPTQVSQKLSFNANQTLTVSYYNEYDGDHTINMSKYYEYQLSPISTKDKYADISFNRYFDYVTPLLIKGTEFKHRWNKIYKDTNIIYDKYNIFSTTENIYDYPGIFFANYKDNADNVSQVDVDVRFPYEWKYFNDNSLYILEDKFEYTLYGLVDYDTLLDKETSEITLEVFKKYLNKKHYKDTSDDNEILFLYNQYEKSYKSENVRLDFQGDKKLYKLKYIFTLK